MSCRYATYWRTIAFKRFTATTSGSITRTSIAASVSPKLPVLFVDYLNLPALRLGRSARPLGSAGRIRPGSPQVVRVSTLAVR